jgi:S-DNA-T family DNA segregation ATPase FtsK/SpoIIIE
MPLTPRHQRELVATVALLVGVFIGLSLLPTHLTGPVGGVTGRFLWQYLGLGAVMLPLLGLALGLAGFGALGPIEPWRVAVLFAGLLPLVPFALGILLGLRHAADLPPDFAQASFGLRLVGELPAYVTVEIASTIGLAGAVILWLLALSGLTIVTLDWHPLRRLAGVRAGGRADGQTGGRMGGSVAARAVGRAGNVITVPDEDEEDDEPQPAQGWREALTRASGRPSARGPGGARSEDLALLPPVDLLTKPGDAGDAGEAELDRLGEVLIATLATFRVEGRIVGRTTGPVVTQFEVAPGAGVKVGRIAALADDLALAMRAQSIRIVAPIPGKAAVGVEVPNPTPRIVTIRELIESPEWDRVRGTLPMALGRDLEGRAIITDLARMPHLLIAGATGSGKSVCINTIITSLVYRYPPSRLRMLMIDPKMVELSSYNALPHLRHAVVTNNREAALVFKWAIHEMEGRYGMFHDHAARNIHDYNRKAAAAADEATATKGRGKGEPAEPAGERLEELPYIVIIVDELADLMMTVQGEVEKPLAILAQKARATGIHLILATQRPSVNVITGLIKANFPSRIAFRVASKVDSRTILDQNGAEALLGNGDMLFLPPGRSEPQRIQGGFISTEETEAITEWYRARHAEREEARQRAGLLEEQEDDIIAAERDREAAEAAEAQAEPGASAGDRDPLFREAAETCIQHQLGSTSLLQRRLRIGYGRAARVIDQLHEAGILGPPDGSRPREVLIGMAQLDEYCK